MNQTNNYQETGNSIPLKIPELINFVHNKLDEYIHLQSATQMEPPTNPFTDPVIFTTAEGKLAQVPADIQKKAISTWQNQQQQQQQQKEQFGKSQDQLGPQGMMMEHFAGAGAGAGTPLDQTSHMSDFNSHPTQFGPGPDPVQHREPVPKGPHRPPMSQQRMELDSRLPYYDPRIEEPQRVVVVEKSDSTLVYLIIFLAVAAVAYYAYKNKKQ